MASTNKTSNIGLNQWVLTDPLLMEDMNADNIKIDTALGANPYVRLIDTTLSANAQQVDLDLSAIDLTKFSMLKVIAEINVTPVATASYIYVKINNSGAYVRAIEESSNNTSRAYVGYIYAGHNDALPGSISMEISGLPASLSNSYLANSFLYGSSYYYGNYYVHQCLAVKPMSANVKIGTINFVTDNSSVYIKAGSRFEVYGVKK